MSVALVVLCLSDLFAVVSYNVALRQIESRTPNEICLVSPPSIIRGQTKYGSNDLCLLYLVPRYFQDSSGHEEDWNYYKQQVRGQKEFNSQLKSLLEAYGCRPPSVRVKTQIIYVVL